MATATDEATDSIRAEMATIFKQIVCQEYATADMGKLHNVKFEFLTVYSRFKNKDTVNVACPCAFYNEFFEYMRGNRITDENTHENRIADEDTHENRNTDDDTHENRITDEDIFVQMCTAIKHGQCKHVSSAESGTITTTSVPALHVAIAAGYPSILQHVPESPTTSAIFRLNDFHVAVLKGYYTYLDEPTQSINSQRRMDRRFHGFVLVEKLPSSMALTVQPRMTLLRYFAKQHNMDMFKKLLLHAWKHRNASDWECVYFIIEEDFIALETLLNQLSNYENSHGDIIEFDCSYQVGHYVLQAAVLKGCQKSLKLWEDFVFKTNQLKTCARECSLDYWNTTFFLDCAIRLGHDTCVEILRKHITPGIEKCRAKWHSLGVLRNITELAGPSQKVHDLVQSVICCELVTYSVVDKDCNGDYKDHCGQRRSMVDYIASSIKCTDWRYNYICAARAIFLSGHVCIGSIVERINAEVKRMSYATLVSTHRQESRQEPPHFEYLLRFILYHNPDLTTLDTAQLLHHALYNDVMKLSSRYLQTHSSDPRHSDLMAFSIILVWQCGLVLSMNDINKDLNFAKLPESVRTFLAHAQTMPRSLKLQCRDKIRRHHAGLRLHELLKTAICPTPLKRYILMEDTLGMTDTTDCLCQTEKTFVPIT